jgi:cellulose synthase/poly-beta-1,6-N-acetylglucosamine synthase-like glycosyltransferase
VGEEVKLPLASIIITNTKLGNNKYLQQSLDSVLAQDYVNKNVVVTSNDDSDKLILDRLTETIIDRDDDNNLIVKGKIDKINVALIKFKKAITVEEMRNVGVAAISNIAHIFGLLDANSYYKETGLVSEAVVQFLQFPVTVGIVQSDYLEYDEKLKVYRHYFKQPCGSLFISKPALEFVANTKYDDIIRAVGSKFIISYLPITGIVKYTNIDIPKNTIYKKMFDEVQAKIKAKQQLNDQA